MIKKYFAIALSSLSLLPVLTPTRAIPPGPHLSDDSDSEYEDVIWVDFNSKERLEIIKNDPNLQSFTLKIKEGTFFLPEWFFSGWKNLTSVDIPTSTEVIGSYAFVGCENLVDINIPNTIKVIGQGAFCGCKNLSSMDIPNGVEIISEGSFFRCENLTNVNIPPTVKQIHRQAFGFCKNLTQITIPDDVTYVDGTAFSKTNLNKILYKGTVYNSQDEFFRAYRYI